jgi:hypothetical protein
MDNEITKLSSNEIEVAKMLGARQAFGLMAGRCSAADASILREIRDAKRFLSFSPTWDEFCEKHLHMSKGNANRVIRLLNELGPAYFTLAQLTRITPDEFRALAPAVKDNALEFRGEAIALIEENAARLGEAVSAMRQPAAGPRGGPREPWEAKIDRIDELIQKSLRSLLYLARDPEARSYAAGALDSVRRELRIVEESWVNLR